MINTEQIKSIAYREMEKMDEKTHPIIEVFLLRFVASLIEASIPDLVPAKVSELMISSPRAPRQKPGPEKGTPRPRSVKYQQRECLACKKMYTPRSPNGQTCFDPACIAVRKAARRAIKSGASPSSPSKGTPRPKRHYQERSCAACQKPFTPLSPNGQFCFDPVCRSARMKAALKTPAPTSTPVPASQA